MRSYGDKNIQVAGLTASGSRFPFAGKADPCSLFNAGRYVNHESSIFITSACAITFCARIFYDLPIAMASMTCLFYCEEAPLHTNHAVSAASLACGGATVKI